MNSCDLWAEIDQAIKEGRPIDNLIPYSLDNVDFDDYQRLLSIYITYGQDPERRAVCARKLNYATRANSI